MQNTHDLDDLGQALIELIGVLNSPRSDDALLREAGVRLDRALFPLLVALGARGALAVGELGELVGRDHTTISRQLAKLESLRLVTRHASNSDRRRRVAGLTAAGRSVVDKIAAARRRLLSQALSGWSETDQVALARGMARFAKTLAAYRQQG